MIDDLHLKDNPIFNVNIVISVVIIINKCLHNDTNA